MHAMRSSGKQDGIWQEAVERTRSRSPASFEQWFSSVEFCGLESSVLTLSARDEFVRDWVKTHFQPDLSAHLEELLGAPIRVEWKVSATIADPVCEAKAVESRPRRIGTAPKSERPSPASSSSFDRAQLTAILNPKYTFPNFVVGPSNELAYAAALASAGGGGPRYNPLFIAGGTGLGKTHLMHAIAHKVLENNPDARVIYVSAEHFTNEFIEALQHHKMDEFRTRYRTRCDLLLLDDIQFLAGREQTQEEFFHTFNALRDADKPIVVTSDKYPQQLQRMPERLVSRFTSGLVADIQVPQLETRVAIVRKKAQLEGISIGDEVAVLLAQTVKSNVRELEGALIRLAAKSSLTGTAHRPRVRPERAGPRDSPPPRRDERRGHPARRVHSLPAVERRSARAKIATRASRSPGRWRCTCAVSASSAASRSSVARSATAITPR